MNAEPNAAYDEFRHEALLYRGLADFVDRTVPFIRGGLEAGESVAVVTSAEHIEALRQALGSHARAVAFADMADVGANPARIIPFWQDFIATRDGRPLRGIGEPIWAGRSAAELAECQRHECLLNVAIDRATPMWLLCPYDLTGLNPEVIDEARRSHPYVTEGLTRRESGVFRGVEGSRAAMAPLPTPPEGCERFAFRRGDLAAVREMVAAGAVQAGMSKSRTEDLISAAHEVASNCVRHGGGAGDLRLWRDDGALITEFRDGGRLEDPLIDRVRPAAHAAGRRGLWLANQLCDLVQIRTLPSGTVVRLHMRV